MRFAKKRRPANPTPSVQLALSAINNVFQIQKEDEAVKRALKRNPNDPSALVAVLSTKTIEGMIALFETELSRRVANTK